MGNSKVSTLRRPGDPRSPCIATLSWLESYWRYSSLQLVNLNGEVSDKVEMPYDLYRGMVTINGEVYVVTQTKILKILPDGTKTELAKLPYEAAVSTRIVAFQSQIYIIQSDGEKMLRFNPADETFNDDLAGCPLYDGFCCCASDSLIYAIGGFGTETSAVEYNPHTNMWTEIAPMQHGRVYTSSVVMNNRVYVLGGWDNPASECYDPHCGTWCEMPRMNVPSGFLHASIIENNLYAINLTSIQAYDGRGWRTVTRWKGRVLDYCCIWPYDSDHYKNVEQLSGEITDRFKENLASEVQTETKVIGQKGGEFKLPDTKITIPVEVVHGEEKVSFSTRTAVQEEDGMLDITPRLHTYNEFSRPISVKMRTSISAPKGESIPVSLQHRNSPSEEWKEIEQLSVGERNEVDFQICRSGERKITVMLHKAAEKLKEKYHKCTEKLVELFKLRIHAINDFYIHSDTGRVVVTISKDQSTHNEMKETLRERNFVPFPHAPNKFKVNLGAKLHSTMQCQDPKDTQIVVKVSESDSFVMDKVFLTDGSRCIYFDLVPEPSCFRSNRLELWYERRLDEKLDCKLDLLTWWPSRDQAEEKGESKKEPGRKIITYFNGPVGQVANGDANIQNQGGFHVSDCHSAVIGKMYSGKPTVKTAGESTIVCVNSPDRTEDTASSRSDGSQHAKVSTTASAQQGRGRMNANNSATADGENYNHEISGSTYVICIAVVTVAVLLYDFWTNPVT